MNRPLLTLPDGQSLPSRSEKERSECQRFAGFHGTRKARWRGVVFSSCLTLTLLTVAVVAAPIPPAERLLPDDTIAMFTVPNAVRLGHHLRQLPVIQLWHDPALKSLREDFLIKWEEKFVKPLEGELGIHLADYLVLAQGQFTFALTQGEQGGDPEASPAYLILLDAKEQCGQLEACIGEVRKKWVEAGKTLRSQRIREVEFTVLTLTSNDVPKVFQKHEDPEIPAVAVTLPDHGRQLSAKPREVAFGQSGSLLILGNSTTAIEKVVAALDGGIVPTLAECAAFETDRLAWFRNAPAYGWIHARRIVDSWSKLPSTRSRPDQPPIPTLKDVLKATGLSGLQTLAFSYGDSGDGPLLQLALRVPESARAGLTKVLSLERKESAPPPFVPAEAVEFQRVRIHGPNAWAALETLAHDISPAWVNVLDLFIQTAEKVGKELHPGFDARRDLIGMLGDDLISWQKPPRGVTLEELEHPPSLTLIGSPDAEKLAVSLANLLAALPQCGRPKEREFLGRKVYCAIPPLFSPPDNPQGLVPTLYYAASGGYVGFSGDVALLEEWLRSGESPPKPLGKVRGLAEALEKAGGPGGGWVRLDNQAAFLRSVFATFKQEPGATTNFVMSGPLTASMGLFTQGKSLHEWLDFSLLPPWETVEKHFHFTVISGSANGVGFVVRFYAPNPPDLKGAPDH